MPVHLRATRRPRRGRGSSTRFTRAAVLLSTLVAAPSFAALSDSPARLHIEDLRLDRTAYASGETATLEILALVEPGWHVNSNTPTYDFLIPTTLELATPSGWPTAEVAWPEARMVLLGFAEEPLSVFEGTFVVTARLTVPLGVSDGTVPLGVTIGYQACDDKSCLPPNQAVAELRVPIGAGGVATPALGAARGGHPAAAPAVSASPKSPERTAPAPLGILLAALLGGLILNLMPCVLPVLSLKVFGLVRAAGHGRRQVASGALATSAGIVASFLALALAAVVAKQAGAAVGWGVQFQQPSFLVFLALIVVLFALNLWGVFEIALPGALADSVDASSSREGLGGHFASGLFATLMATPCSAPFLGTAVSFALGQAATTTLLVFGAVGVGMALPYLALAAWPGAARLLPRPGDWMNTLKGVMGFLLAGAAIWLLYVLSALIRAEDLAFVEIALLGLGLAVWLRTRARRAGERALWAIAALLVSAAAIWVAAAAPPAAADRATAGSESGGIAWVPFEEQAAERLAAEGRIVFVDVTADWCLTCKVNERLVLDRGEVVDAFRRHQVVAMKADWTRRDDAIAAYLARYDRTGIPFYVAYRPGQAPHVFGEVLTVDGVIEVLEASAAP